MTLSKIECLPVVRLLALCACVRAGMRISGFVCVVYCFAYHLLAVLYRTAIFASACASPCLSRVVFLALFQTMLGCGPANYARVHARLPLVSCSVLHICCVYVDYKATSIFACACAFTRVLHYIILYVPSYICVWCAYMRMHTRVGVAISM